MPRGDNGKFRTSMELAGFKTTNKIYNEKRKDLRRLKLHNATKLMLGQFQDKLLKQLKKEFGDRFIRGYYIENEPECCYAMSFCVELKL